MTKRDDLIALVNDIMDIEDNTEEETWELVNLFTRQIIHPAGQNLIYRQSKVPEAQVIFERAGRESLTSEEIVDIALAYKPIQLGPANDAAS